MKIFPNKNFSVKFFRMKIFTGKIKTHDSESRGQEEAAVRDE